MKFKSKVKMAFYISPDQYWSIQYISVVTNRTASEIIEEAIKFTVKHINQGNHNPHKPQNPKKRIRVDAHITRDSLIAVSLIKINENMFGWSNTDFCRYGLKRTILSYAERYPDIKKILNKYNES